jgi:FkbM family methyltransferase
VGSIRLRAARALDRLPYFRGRERLVARVLRGGGETQLDVGGFTLRLDLRDGLARAIAMTGSLPSEMAQILAEVAQPGMTAVDVGASIGYTTMAIARAVGPQGRVYAFEPGALAHAQLRRNLAENGFDWVIVERVACGDAAGTGELNVSKVATDVSSLAPVASARAEKVPIVRLDERVSAPVDLVKVDVEGAEWAALRGRAPRPRILASIAPDPRRGDDLAGGARCPFGCRRSAGRAPAASALPARSSFPNGVPGGRAPSASARDLPCVVVYDPCRAWSAAAASPRRVVKNSAD